MRGHATGYIRAFDKHLNLIMYDVHEKFSGEPLALRSSDGVQQEHLTAVLCSADDQRGAGWAGGKGKAPEEARVEGEAPQAGLPEGRQRGPCICAAQGTGSWGIRQRAARSAPTANSLGLSLRDLPEMVQIEIVHFRQIQIHIT